MPDQECLDRRAKMSDEELDIIAEKLEKRIYEGIGKSVVQKFIWILGLTVTAVYVYLNHLKA